ncbi:MAG TPA: hypothetical protein VME19_06790 [Streptosporangiaceae bacterium]|nr:hypothetical protein [Streptosporangiaceae bacterium]
MAVNVCVQRWSPTRYSTVADTRFAAGRDTSRIRKAILSLVCSLSCAAANHSGECCWTMTHPASAT